MRPKCWRRGPMSWSPDPRSSPVRITPLASPRCAQRGSRPLCIDRIRVDTISSFDNLHPLEIKVLTAFGADPSGAVLTTERLAAATALEPSQLSMAIEWLLAKQLLVVQSETITPVASLTPLGETYFEQYSPIERILSAARDASGTGKRLTIPDL